MLSKRFFISNVSGHFWTSPIKVHLWTSLNSSDSTCSGPGLKKEKTIYIYHVFHVLSQYSSYFVNQQKHQKHPSSNFDEGGGVHLSSEFLQRFFAGSLKEWWQLERKVWDLRLPVFWREDSIGKDWLTSTYLHLSPPPTPEKLQGQQVACLPNGSTPELTLNKVPKFRGMGRLGPK